MSERESERELPRRSVAALKNMISQKSHSHIYDFNAYAHNIQTNKQTTILFQTSHLTNSILSQAQSVSYVQDQGGEPARTPRPQSQGRQNTKAATPPANALEMTTLAGKQASTPKRKNAAPSSIAVPRRVFCSPTGRSVVPAPLLTCSTFKPAF